MPICELKVVLERYWLELFWKLEIFKIKLKYLSFRWLGNIISENSILETQGQNIWNKIKKLSRIEDQKIWMFLLLRNFWPLLLKFFLLQCRMDTSLSCIRYQLNERNSPIFIYFFFSIPFYFVFLKSDINSKQCSFLLALEVHKSLGKMVTIIRRPKTSCTWPLNSCCFSVS